MKKLKRQEAEDEALRAVLATPAGQRLIWRLLEQTRMFGSSFAGENTHVTAFNEGRRHVGTWLLKECLTVDPVAYTTLQNEAARFDESYPVSRETKPKGEEI